MNINFSYYKCQTCHARVECEGCEQEVLSQLAEVPGIRGAEIIMVKKELYLDTDLDDDSVEEILEDCGLFVC